MATPLPSIWTMIAVALAAAAVAALSFAALDLVPALVSCALGWTMLAITVSDARRFIVPDVLSLPAIVAGLLSPILVADDLPAGEAQLVRLAAAMLGAAIFYAIRQLYFRARGRHGLGLGDVKLAAAAGAWTSLEGLSAVLLLATVSAIGAVLIGHAVGKRPLDGAAAVPFGAFIAPAIWLVWWSVAAGFVALSDPVL